MRDRVDQLQCVGRCCTLKKKSIAFMVHDIYRMGRKYERFIFIMKSKWFTLTRLLRELRELFTIMT